jgi:hypothetical protein
MLRIVSASDDTVYPKKISSDRLDSPREWNSFLQKCDQMTARTRPRNPELL